MGLFRQKQKLTVEELGQVSYEFVKKFSEGFPDEVEKRDIPLLKKLMTACLFLSVR